MRPAYTPATIGVISQLGRGCWGCAQGKQLAKELTRAMNSGAKILEEMESEDEDEHTDLPPEVRPRFHKYLTSDNLAALVQYAAQAEARIVAIICF